MNISVDTPENGNTTRMAFRTRVPGLAVRIDGKLHAVRDVSALGVAIECGSVRFSQDQEVRVDLILGDKDFITAIPATVARNLSEGGAGLAFNALDRRKQELLDKLILEVQKRVIASRRAQTTTEP